MSPEAFREDAGPAQAIEREQELQRCRARLNERRIFKESWDTPDYQPWTAEDLAALEWTDSLAAAGHYGAQRVMERLIEDRSIIEQLQDVAPAKLRVLAVQWPRVASFLARKEAARECPDWELLQRYLAIGDLDDPQRAVEMGELRTILGELGTTELGALRRDMGALRRGADRSPSGRETGQLLFECAQARSIGEEAARREAQARIVSRFSHSARDHRSADARALVERAFSGAAVPSGGEDGTRRVARALMESAATLGMSVAWEKILEVDLAAAPDKAAFMLQWLDAGHPFTLGATSACMRIGADLERGTATTPADFEQALGWYERTIGKQARDDSGALIGSFCCYVAFAFDRRMTKCVLDDAPMAARWYQRSLERGDEDSMYIWLSACVNGDLGLSPDPVSALERVKSYLASGVDLKARRWRVVPAIDKVHTLAAAHTDPALAARWREVATLLERQ